jgi:hypothetical protein
VQLGHFFENSAIPTVMEQYGFQRDRGIREILKWQYLDKAKEGDTSALLGQLVQVSWKNTVRAMHM